MPLLTVECCTAVPHTPLTIHRCSTKQSTKWQSIHPCTDRSITLDVLVDASHKNGAAQVAQGAAQQPEPEAEHEGVAKVEARLEESCHRRLRAADAGIRYGSDTDQNARCGVRTLRHLDEEVVDRIEGSDTDQIGSASIHLTLTKK